MNDIALAKKHLRNQIRKAISKLSPSDKLLESQTMVQLIAEFISDNHTIKTVASYAATKDELNLDHLPSLLPEIRFSYPKCSPDGIMEFYVVDDLLEMKPLTMGIREPDPKLHKQLSADSIDLFICPAFAYSEDGKRLGKGGGYYDRYLCKKRYNATTLGVVFDCQKVTIDEIPTEAHDLLINYIL